MTIAPSKPAVRRVTREDLPALQKLWAGLTPADPLDPPLDGVPVQPDLLLADPATILLWSVVDRQPVGVACFRKQSAASAELVYIGILAQYQRLGHATALLTSGVFSLLPVAALTSAVPEGRQAAASWLHSRGFRAAVSDDGSGTGDSTILELRFDRPARTGCESCTHQCGGAC